MEKFTTVVLSSNIIFSGVTFMKDGNTKKIYVYWFHAVASLEILLADQIS
jgi:hypothetical protein